VTRVPIDDDVPLRGLGKHRSELSHVGTTVKERAGIIGGQRKKSIENIKIRLGPNFDTKYIP
jgi:hypothetical protein